MLILLPVILMLLTALTLILLRFTRPNFKYPWMLAAGGGTLSLVAVFLWQIRFPGSVSLPPWQPVTVFFYSPTFLADGTSWPYALALAALAAAVIWTSVVRNENEAFSWAGTLLLTSLGILAVSAGNPLTLVLAWSAIDLAEVVTMLRSTEGEGPSESVVIAFAVRIAGTGLVLWASMVSNASGMTMNFQNIPARAGIFLLIAVGLRLGVLPLHLPYQKDSNLRRGFGTMFRLVSAGASLALLARIPASALDSPLPPYLLLLTGIAALYAGWMWLRASDEIVGRPFWVLGLAALAVAASLRGNPSGSVGWGVALITSGGLLFLFSARQRSIRWLPLLGLWGLSALPFSPSAAAWQSGNDLTWLLLLPLLPAQALLMAGFIRHSLHPGETSLESQEKWVKLLYPAGLFLLVTASIVLGLWGWAGARTVGPWWLALIAIAMTLGFAVLAFRVLVKRKPSASARWLQLLRLQWLYDAFTSVFQFLRRIADLITTSLEGEGGLLWSFLLMVLIFSIISTGGR